MADSSIFGGTNLSVQPMDTQQQAPAAPQPAPAPNPSQGIGQAAVSQFEMASPLLRKNASQIVSNLLNAGAAPQAVAKMAYNEDPHFAQKVDAVMPQMKQANGDQWMQTQSAQWALNQFYKNGEGNSPMSPTAQAATQYIQKQQAQQNPLVTTASTVVSGLWDMLNSPLQALHDTVTIPLANDIRAKLGKSALPATSGPQLQTDAKNLTNLATTMGMVMGGGLTGGALSAEAAPAILQTRLGAFLARAMGAGLGSMSAGLPAQAGANAMLGTNNNQTGGQMFTSGALGQAGGDLIAGTVGKLLAPFADDLRPDAEELMATMKKYGIPIQPSGLMDEGSKAAGRLAGMEPALPESQVASGIGNMAQGITQEAAGGAAEVGGPNFTNQGLNNFGQDQGLGQFTSDTFNAAKTAHKGTAQALYGASEQALNNAVDYASQTDSYLPGTVKPEIDQVKPPDVSEALQTLKSRASDISASLKTADVGPGADKIQGMLLKLENAANVQTPSQILKFARDLRTTAQVLKETIPVPEPGTTSVQTGVLQHLAGQLTDAYDEFAGQFNDLGPLEQSAKDYYRQFAPRFAQEAPLPQAISNAGRNVSQIPDNLLQSFSGNKADLIPETLQTLGPTAKPALQAKLIQNFFDAARDPETGVFSSKKFAGAIATYGEDSAKGILSPEQFDALTQAQKIMQAVDAKPSDIGTLKKLFSFIGGKGMFLNPKNLITYGLEKAVQALGGTDEMLQYLTTGLQLPEGVQAGLQAGVGASVVNTRTQDAQGGQAAPQAPTQQAERIPFNDWATQGGKSVISQGYNGTADQEMGVPFKDQRQTHESYDLQGPPGYEWKPLASGTVVSAGPEKGTGNTVRIQDAQGNTYIYGHFSQLNSDIMKPGTQVSTNTPLGIQGHTGFTNHSDTHSGDHLFLEVHDPNGNIVDPASYFTA